MEKLFGNNEAETKQSDNNEIDYGTRCKREPASFWFQKNLVNYFFFNSMKNPLLNTSAAVFCLLFLSFRVIWAGETSVHRLKVQDTTEPLAIEDTHPLFSWQMQSDVVGQSQKAYRIVVIRESDDRVVWDSQKVENGVSNNIRYMGVALQPEMAYRWQLTVWDVAGKDYSASSRFPSVLKDSRDFDITAENSIGIDTAFRTILRLYTETYKNEYDKKPGKHHLFY